MDHQMHDIYHLIQSLKERGATLLPENGQIRIQAPKGILSHEDVFMLRERKAVIIPILEDAELDPRVPIGRRVPSSTVPLTALQLRTWKTLRVHGPPQSMRIAYIAMRIEGPLDTFLMQHSLEVVVNRHEALRARFLEKNGTPECRIYESPNWRFEVIDLSRFDGQEAEDEVRRLSGELILETFDLSIGPLFAVRLFKLPDCGHILILTLDHMISDGVSIEVLSHELWTLYRQRADDSPALLPELPIQFPDYALWQQRTYAAWLRLHGSYWRQHFCAAPPTRIPHDERLSGVECPAGALLRVPFGDVLSVKLRELAHLGRTLPALVILAIYVVLMSRWCRQRELIVSFPSDGRYRPELMGMIGWISGPLYLRVDVSENERFLDLVTRVTLEFTSAYDHYDFNRLPDLVPECVTDLFFNCLPRFFCGSQPVGYPWQANNQLKITPFAFTVPRPLAFAPFLLDCESGMTVVIEYRRDLFAPATIENLGRNLRRFAKEFAFKPEARVGSVFAKGM